MSNWTYVCRSCGSLRRRPKVYGYPGTDQPDWPHCCDKPMLALAKVYAEAATKLDDAGRVEWLRLGHHVVRRSRHRWEPAMTEGQIARAKEQLALYKAEQQSAS